MALESHYRFRPGGGEGHEAYGCEDRVLVLGRSVASSSSPAQRGRATHGHIPTVVIPQQIRFLHCSAHSSTQSINQSVSTRSRKFRQQSPKPPGSVRPNANLLAHLNPPRSSPKPTTTIQVAKSIPLRPFLFQFGLNLSKNQLHKLRSVLPPPPDTSTPHNIPNFTISASASAATTSNTPSR